MCLLLRKRCIAITNEKPKKYRMVKCPHCEQQVDRNIDPFQEHSGRYYHQSCFDNRQAKIDDRDRLLEYICELHDIEFANMSIRKQIKEYQEHPYYFTLRGILTTLRYVHEIEGIPVKEGTGIGIIEFYYKKAVEYYTNLIRVRDRNAELTYNSEEEIVYSTLPKKRKQKTINIEEL